MALPAACMVQGLGVCLRGGVECAVRYMLQGVRITFDVLYGSRYMEHVYIYIYICTYIQIHVHIYIYLYIYILLYIDICIYFFIHIYIHAHIYAHIYVYIYMYIHICMYVNIYGAELGRTFDVLALEAVQRRDRHPCVLVHHERLSRVCVRIVSGRARLGAHNLK